MLGTHEEPAAAEAFVGGLSNVKIKNACSEVFYNYDAMSDAIKLKR